MRAGQGGEAVTPLTDVLSTFPATVGSQEASAFLQNGYVASQLLLVSSAAVSKYLTDRFGLPVSYDLLTFDPVQAIFDGLPGAEDGMLCLDFFHGLLCVLTDVSADCDLEVDDAAGPVLDAGHLHWRRRGGRPAQYPDRPCFESPGPV